MGKALVDALEKSRVLPIEEARALQSNIAENYQKRVSKIMERYGYKTKRALFKNMMMCDLYCHEGIITIEPNHHEKIEAWSGDGFTEDDYIKISADSPPAEIGAALRLAFSRCTGLGAYSAEETI